MPWGNMYEFTLSGTFVVAAAYLLLYAAASGWRGWRRSCCTLVLSLLMTT